MYLHYLWLKEETFRLGKFSYSHFHEFYYHHILLEDLQFSLRITQHRSNFPIICNHTITKQSSSSAIKEKRFPAMYYDFQKQNKTWQKFLKRKFVQNPTNHDITVISHSRIVIFPSLHFFNNNTFTTKGRKINKNE